MKHWITLAILFACWTGVKALLYHDMHPLRVEACKAAGGDGRYETRDDGACRASGDLWCAKPNGTVFPVLDPPYPSKETLK